MSSRIEKGGHRFQPKLAAGARRRPGQSNALPAPARPPPSPSPAGPTQDRPSGRSMAAAGSGAMSPPPPPPPRSIRTPSASPHPSGSATGAIRSYASATPSSSRIQAAGQSPVNFKPTMPKAASIVPGSGPGPSRGKPSGGGVARITPSMRPSATPVAGDAVAVDSGIQQARTAASDEQSKAFSPPKRPVRVGAPSVQPESSASGSGGAKDPSSSSSARQSIGATSQPMEAGPSSQGANVPAEGAARQTIGRPKASSFIPTGSTYRPSNIQFAAPPGHPSTRQSVDPPAAGIGNPESHLRSETESSDRPSKRRPASENGDVPSSAFDLFCQDREAPLLEVNPNITCAALTKLLEEAWMGASNQEKSYWEEKHQELVMSHRTEQDGMTTHGPDWSDQVSTDAGAQSDEDVDASPSASTAGKRKRVSTKRPKRKKQAGEPKRPASAYLLYSQEIRKNQSSQGQSSERSKEGFGEMSKRIGDQWRNLPLEEKQPYLRQAEDLKKQYDREMEAWKAEHPELAEEEPEDTDADESLPRPRRKARAKVVKPTVSDDEREYQALVAEHGRDLEDLRLDPKATSMADLAIAELKSGRASQRLFDLNRVRLKQLEEAAALRKVEKQKLRQRMQQTEENLRKQKAGERVDLPKHDPRRDDPRRHGGSQLNASQQHQSDSHANTSSSETVPAPNARTAEQEDEEEVEALSGMDVPQARYIVPGLDDSDDDEDNEVSSGHARGGAASRHGRSAHRAGSDDDDAASDNGSVRSATSGGTYASLRETAHVPQMRVVDGQIVLDETSLTVNRNQEQAFEESEMIDEEIGHKFVNSSTGSKREKSVRWTAVETDKFFKAVSMWGSDFEMISRMFPNRSRKQVKNKWTREERANPTRLDVAFARRLPVDLDRYAIMANVDLSGPAPRVDDGAMGVEESKLIKKGEASDDEGREEGDETDGEVRKIDKVSATPDPSRARRGSSAGEAGGARSLRASSVASARSTAGAGGDASSSRQQQQKTRQQIEREKRESREKARRADSLREGREKRSVSRGVSRGAQDDAEDYGAPEEEEVEELPAEGFY
ncbi:hypothetical protein BCV69DRAFT_284234 [Microstroma glucosiphilum]|uniref:HMG box domain-containing protein n=1 Tax=Pseudomicrostroma glucosiphilum TaxID=1684307 RepID=A0A316U5J8_9BASI|nr:hypothetical protein BCV69DRAFT_284234 [Pseudomicrostroma glucosiphilum]PWN19603.1 hypothetical protein BCV69DRAFT_284234 [Pseudomicrostroma glucosiphilum]